MITISFREKYSKWNLLWKTIRAPFAERRDLLEARLYEQLYSLFDIDRETVERSSGRFTHSALLNPFQFLSLTRLLTGDVKNRAIVDNHGTKVEYKMFLEPIWRLYSHEIEVVPPVKLTLAQGMFVDIGYSFDNQSPPIAYKERPSVEGFDQDASLVMLNDPGRLFELLLIVLLVNRAMIIKSTSRVMITLYVMLNWEVANYLFMELIYKDAAADPLYNKSRFRQLKFQRIVHLLFNFYFAPLDDPTFTETVKTVFEKFETWRNDPPNTPNTYSRPVYDTGKGQFIMEEIIQPAGNKQQSLFTFSPSINTLQ